MRHSGSSVNSIWKRVVHILGVSDTADLSLLNCATLIIVLLLTEVPFGQDFAGVLNLFFLMGSETKF